MPHIWGVGMNGDVSNFAGLRLVARRRLLGDYFGFVREKRDDIRMAFRLDSARGILRRRSFTPTCAMAKREKPADWASFGQRVLQGEST